MALFQSARRGFESRYLLKMKEKNRLKKDIKLTKDLIKRIEKGFGRDKCKSYAPGCPNCDGQILLGHLDNFLGLLEWELKEDYSVKAPPPF